MDDRTAASLLSWLLPQVSRSFALSLRVLPRSLRRPIGLAYLFCRAADTIADTALLPRAVRLNCLDHYRAAFADGGLSALTVIGQHLGGQPQRSAERALLAHLAECFLLLSTMEQGDQRYIRELVLTLTQGMQMDLTLFPGEREGQIGALETRADLDRYTYCVAGCVGEFWTRVAVAHLPSLQHWHLAEMEGRAVRFGKGLQLTNILRDLAQDLRLGRCYLPRAELAALGVRPEDLLTPSAAVQLRPLLSELLDLTLAYYRDGWGYTLAVPRREWRLRLACAWPLLIGVATLSLVAHSPALLDPAVRLKITRLQVYRILWRSLLTVWSDRALTHYYSGLLKGLSQAVSRRMERG